MRKLEIALLSIWMCNVDMHSMGSKSECFKSSSSVVRTQMIKQNNRIIPLRLKGGNRGGYDFYSKESRGLGSFENSTALSRVPAWDATQVILRPKGHDDWLRITAHQKEVTAMIVIRFEGREYLISGDGYGAMLVWDTESWQCVRELAGHRFRSRIPRRRVPSPAPTYQTNRLPPTTPPARHRPTPPPPRRRRRRSQGVKCLAASPDGSAVYSGGADCDVWAWRPRAGAEAWAGWRAVRGVGAMSFEVDVRRNPNAFVSWPGHSAPVRPHAPPTHTRACIPTYIRTCIEGSYRPTYLPTYLIYIR
jgi:WD40 repeat protein